MTAEKKMGIYATWIATVIWILAACSAPEGPAPNGEWNVTVVRVIDGDTFEIDGGQRVRMIGIDTPESVKPGHPVERYGKEASEYTRKLLEDQQVRLVFDVELYDAYKRLLAYVYLPDGTFVNEKLLRDGYARVLTIPPNVAHAKTFVAAEREAREQLRGLWSEDDDDQAAQPGDAPPEGKRIKGNINSKGERIYHLPGSPAYEQTKAEVWFATEEEAREAGFRPPKR